jgi:hypothetical protein
VSCSEPTARHNRMTFTQRVTTMNVGLSTRQAAPSCESCVIEDMKAHDRDGRNDGGQEQFCLKATTSAKDGGHDYHVI